MIVESRAVTGLAAPRSTSGRVWPERGGLAVHWAGDHQAVTSMSHFACRARLRQWQDFHVKSRGWVDLAYNWVVCNHGIVMVGRGWGVRSAANGTNDGNDRFLAACWMGGVGDGAPSALALDAFEWLVQEVRRRGGGKDVQPHRTFFSTSCPGDVLAAHCAQWRNRVDAPAAAGKPTVHTRTAPRFPLPTGWYFGPRSGPKESVSGFYSHRADLAVWQAKAGLRGRLADGLYGDLTAAAARRVQRAHGLAVDGRIGAQTWAATWR